MTRAFPLAGLLRLRKLEEDMSASELARVRRAQHENSARIRTLRAVLGDSEVDPDSIVAIQSIAAARASSASMLGELGALDREIVADVEVARAAHEAAHAKSLGLEKLEAKHTATEAVTAQRLEQLVLDELAARAWHLQNGEVTE
jgi:flagellar protein FliJ